MYLYIIKSSFSDKFYLGITSNIKRRISSHRWASSGKKSKLYHWMRKHPDWCLEVVCEYNTKEEACSEEVFWIAFGRKQGWPLLNLADGGEGGYVVPNENKEVWKMALRAARVGRKPALGMEHTKENRKIFSEVSRKYWDSQSTYNSEEVLKYPFRQSKNIFGISKTHYYRLKRSLPSE